MKLALLSATILVFWVWLLVVSMASAFVDGVSFPPTVGDFRFNPELYAAAYGCPPLIVGGIFLFFRLTKRSRKN